MADQISLALGVWGLVISRIMAQKSTEQSAKQKYTKPSYLYCQILSWFAVGICQDVGKYIFFSQI